MSARRAAGTSACLSLAHCPTLATYAGGGLSGWAFTDY